MKLKDLNRAVTIDENQLAKRRIYEQKTNQGKTVLRKAMSRLVPAEVTERVKQGFSAPDASWFRGESIDYVNAILRDRNARIYEFLSPDYVLKRFDEHCSGKHNHRLFIWSTLCFDWWLRKFIN
jgi:asparagine synthase (glutamine-hydrolysing)